ncbi:MAG: hypothetical protein M3R63_19295 [Actinomycetota bacterium]|nr:hypothetical protein [Actinomycetota bacterium]
MSEARAGLTSAEQHAAEVMVRFAAEAGYRNLRWSIPNNATWVHPTLAAVPVRHDGLYADSYDLLGRRRFGSHVVVCLLVRREGTFEVLGIPSEEWLRPQRAVGPPPSTTPPRRRATAAALGLLIPLAALGGGIVVMSTAGQGPDSSSVPTPVPTAQTPPLPVGGVEWASAAKVALASVREQLAVLAEAERAWNALPAQQRAGEPPAAVRELVAERARLEQQRAALEADLTAWRALQRTTRALADTEEQLGNVTRASQLRGTSGDQLREQRDVLTRQRDTQREQLEDWSAGVETAVGSPLPDPPNMAPLAGSVLALTRELPGLAGADDGAPVIVPTQEPDARVDSPEPAPALVPEVDALVPEVDALVPEVDVDLPAGLVPGAVLVPVETDPGGGPLDFLVPDGAPPPATPAPLPVDPMPAEPEQTVDDILGALGRFGPSPTAAAPPAVGAPPPTAPAPRPPEPQDMWKPPGPSGG